MIQEYRKAMDGLHLSPEADERIRTLLTAACTDEQEVIPMKHPRKKYSALAIAAIVAVCLLAGTALAAALSRVNMVITDITPLHEALSDTEETKHYTIDFDTVDDQQHPLPTELGHWYPQTLPDGFALSFVSEQMSGFQRFVWQNESGDQLSLVCETADDFSDISIDGVLSVEDIEVNGVPGKLFTGTIPEINSTYQALFWTSPEQGIGFYLDYEGSQSVDILAIAESIVRTDESEAPTPTYAEEKYEALMELGDYLPAIPEGYELYEFTGMPKEHGGGWYAYVHRHWQNENGDAIHFGYESFVPAEDAVNVHWTTFEEALEKAAAGESSINWADPDLGLSFMLSADALSSDQFIALMESITHQ